MAYQLENDVEQRANQIEYSWDELTLKQQAECCAWWPNSVDTNNADEYRYRFNYDGTVRDATK